MSVPETRAPMRRALVTGKPQIEKSFSAAIEISIYKKGAQLPSQKRL